MPSGYTSTIYDGRPITFPEFALHCARAFGALIELRDTPDAEIPDKFEADSHHHHRVAEASAHRERSHLRGRRRPARLRARDDRPSAHPRGRTITRFGVRMMSAYWDLVNLGVCIKGQAERLGIEHEGVPLEGVVVRLANAKPKLTVEELDAATYALCDYDTDLADRGLPDDLWYERRGDALRVIAALGFDVPQPPDSETSS